MSILPTNSIIFKHMIDLKSCGCVFCYTQEESSGRTRLFLIFKDKGRVYSRNGLRGIWEEMNNPQESAYILETYSKAIAEQKIPCFATSVQELTYV
ncbi:MAG: hypothetical protein KA403_01510 [Candidatus Omnitrophica bacterium]|nr:hypothetical protein [Candidatus Omnitrophota bacterium]